MKLHEFEEGMNVAQVVSAFLMSHTTFMVELYDQAKPDQAQRFTEGLEKAKAMLQASRPDVAIISGSDHVRTFFYDNVPAFCIGVGEKAQSWGDGGTPSTEITVHSDMARFMLREALNRGWDIAYSEDMRLDHAYLIPITQLLAGMDIPIVPIFQNCNLPPYTTMKRCLEVGGILREIIEAWPGSERVALIGSGGISHWVGVPEMGKINPEFDRTFISQIEQKDFEAIAAYTEEQIEELGGNGAQELRAWATVLGATKDFDLKSTCYEPIEEWATGMGIMAGLAPSVAAEVGMSA